jgi:hypothetical protein
MVRKYLESPPEKARRSVRSIARVSSPAMTFQAPLRALLLALMITLPVSCGSDSGQSAPRKEQRGAKPSDQPRPVDPPRAMNKAAWSDPGTEMRFVVFGHAYGSNKETEDTVPSRPLVRGVEEINRLDPDFVMSLGDTVRIADEEQLDTFDRLVGEPLLAPLFNAVGNHDVAGGDAYKQRYGATTAYAFDAGSSVMVVLDTEQGQCALDASQLTLLDDAFAQAGRRDAKAVFVFMHKTWLVRDPRHWTSQHETARPNDQKCQLDMSTRTRVNTALEKAAQERKVFVFSGDVGAWGNLTPYYERHASLPLHLVATGLGDTERDNFLQVDVNGDEVKITVRSLTGGMALPIRTYTFDFWLSQPSLEGAPLAAPLAP